MVEKMNKWTPISKDEVTKKCGQAFWFILGLAIATALCLLIAVAIARPKINQNVCSHFSRTSSVSIFAGFLISPTFSECIIHEHIYV